MKIRLLTVLACALALAAMTPPAQAGAVRYVGAKIAKGTSSVTSAAASGGATVAGGVESAGKTSGNVLVKGADATADGVVAVGKGAKAAPAAVAHGTVAASKAVWKAVW
jgi:hypothetical protein